MFYGQEAGAKEQVDVSNKHIFEYLPKHLRIRLRDDVLASMDKDRYNGLSKVPEKWYNQLELSK